MYRGMDIGTAKPSHDERCAVRHWGLDLIEPSEHYTVVDFADYATTTLEKLMRSGTPAIFVGGSGFYLAALLAGPPDAPAPDEEVRERLTTTSESLDSQQLWQRLADVDPVRAEQISPADRYRTLRALEIAESKNENQPEQEEPLFVRYPPCAIWYGPAQRRDLDTACASRFNKMLADGIRDEGERLQRRYPNIAEIPAGKLVGYRHLWSWLAGSIDREEYRERSIQDTCQLVKRQYTYMRSQLSQLSPVDPGSSSLEDMMDTWQNAEGQWAS